MKMKILVNTDNKAQKNKVGKMNFQEDICI